MPSLRHLLFAAVPKVSLSRLTGLAAGLPLPRALRRSLFGAFARRYRADLGELDRDLREFASFRAFFSRPLRPGARRVDRDRWPVSPCDGTLIGGGPLAADAVLDIKGNPLTVAELLGGEPGAARFAGGSHLSIYLAPGDYHRVHAPFAGRLVAVRQIAGTLYPVNPAAQRSIPRLFAQNARTVFEFALADGRSGAVVMIGAFNVGDITPSAAVGDGLEVGDELGRFGFGSSVVALLAPGAPAFAHAVPGAHVRQGVTCAEPRPDRA